MQLFLQLSQKKVTKGEGLVENAIVPSTFTKQIAKGEGLVENVVVLSTFTKQITRGEGLVKNTTTFSMSKSKGQKTTNNKVLKLLVNSPNKSLDNQPKCGKK